MQNMTCNPLRFLIILIFQSKPAMVLMLNDFLGQSFSRGHVEYRQGVKVVPIVLVKGLGEYSRVHPDLAG